MFRQDLRQRQEVLPAGCTRCSECEDIIHPGEMVVDIGKNGFPVRHTTLACYKGGGPFGWWTERGFSTNKPANSMLGGEPFAQQRDSTSVM